MAQRRSAPINAPMTEAAKAEDVTITGDWTFSGVSTFTTWSNHERYILIDESAGATGIYLDSKSNAAGAGLNTPSIRWREDDGTSVAAIRGYVDTDDTTNKLVLGTGWFTELMRLSSDGSHEMVGNLNVNAGSGNTTVTLESSTGDCALYIKADTDNNNENENPFLRFEQDANGVQLVIGTTGDANLDAQGNTFTDCSANGAAIHALYTSGSLALGVGGSVGLKFASNNDATFYGNVTIDGGNKLKALDSGNDDSVGVYCDGTRGWLTPLDQTTAYEATCVSGSTTTSSWPGFQVLDVRLVADDASESWSLLVDGGVYIVTSGSTSATENSCLFAQWSGSSAQNSLSSSGGAIWSLGAGSNPDVDGDHNIWFTNSGSTLNIKNRRGTARYYMVYVFSGRS